MIEEVSSQAVRSRASKPKARPMLTEADCKLGFTLILGDCNDRTFAVLRGAKIRSFVYRLRP
ncbi:MAG: hypothetical protein CO108_06325 [Deltaproteobacteria bacterium CG_4_9_14_3_um_filter_63_12]|nr:MAG: hypothetical protein CO108_06325 [Deltaproteobacteria bacterium CG_4_9_14_3_um_filter_63_12]